MSLDTDNEKLPAVGVIIVNYNNSDQNFLPLKGVDGLEVIVVDNTPGRDLGLTEGNVHYLPIKENTGIAHAQNVGIREASCLGCQYIVFFDQDSVLSADLVRGMVAEHKRIKTFVPNLFLLGPTVVNAQSNEEYRGVFDRNGDDDGFQPRLDIISSGSCADIDTVRKVGGLDERLFIDSVDQEWCWRAASKGFQSGITTRERMMHSVGLNEKKLLGASVIISSPGRYYYQTRNWLWLMRRSYVPRRWKINTTIKKLTYPWFYPFMTGDWRKIYANMLRGMRDGLKTSGKGDNCI